MSIFKHRDIRRKIKEVAIGVALLSMTGPMLSTAIAQSPKDSSEPLPVDASSNTLGCGTATNIGQANMAPLYVDGFPCISAVFPNANAVFTNIKICAPGNKTNCQVIDHVQVDTGSVGLRIASSVVNSKLLKAMPYIPTSGPQILTSCAVFSDGSLLYGPVQTADVYIAGKFAKNFPLQIFGKFTAPDNGCGVGGFSFPRAANGLLGVSLSVSGTDIDYTCNTDGSSCQPDLSTSVTTPNLVSKLQNDNNGVALMLNAIPDSGATVPVLGLLILGVGTQADNTPPEGTIPLLANPSSRFVNLLIGNNATPALIDSGTSFLAVNDPGLPLCSVEPGFYCPSSPTAISLGLYSYNATTPAYNVAFPVGNADYLIANAGIAGVAYNDLAVQSGGGLAFLGLSMFFGRTMYFVFNGQQSPLGTGPINAIWPQQ